MRKTGLFYLLLIFVTHLSMGQSIKVGLLFDQFASARWEVDAGNLKEEFSKLGVETILKVAHSSIEKQIAQTQELVDEGVNAIIVVAVDGSNSSAIIDIAKANNVIVVAYDRPILDNRVDLYVSYNNLEVGKMQAKSMMETVKNGNIILINGPVADINAIQFRKGHLETLKPYVESGQIKIVQDLVLDNWSDVSALMRLYEVAPDFTQIKGVISAVDWFNDAAIEYAGDSAIFTNIYMTGQDPSTATAIKIEKGIQNMTVFKPIDVLSKKAAEMTMARLKKQEIKGLQNYSIGEYTLSSYLFNPIFIDKNNLNEYRSQFNK
ncbi:substrate-binding domain-containing protein [Reichenbachiella agarivorans]|uniref:Substrate-binding domain-containing protein n=1 Tax=Reichenbachiella agarivorans TaxID=2979464 RepID=A0ABY6CQG9_9BACT|nr:substrate-binding domain-containing protein [Reichenbachiella agarivorans]UXP32765.1 substrate-binding domain-containing protein [Reichenbachiella agarivorans]